MTFANEADLLRNGARQETSQFISRMREAAVDALQKDLADASLREPPGAYLTRANAIALGLADGGAPVAAEAVYQALTAAIDRHNEAADETRYKGLVLANQAMLNMALQRFDVGIPLMQYVIHVEDPRAYGVAAEDSYGNQLRRNQLDDPALGLLLQVLRDQELPLGDVASKHELERAFDFLGSSTHVFYGIMLGLAQNIRFALRTPEARVNYMALRIFDAFRAYAFFLEELVGRLAVVEANRRGLDQPQDVTGIELRVGLKLLFGREGEERSWWQRADRELQTNTQRCRGQPIDAQNARLEELAESQPEATEDTLVTCLAVLHLVRNLGAHEIYPPAYLVAPEIHLERALAWLTAAAILIHREYISPTSDGS